MEINTLLKYLMEGGGQKEKQRERETTKLLQTNQSSADAAFGRLLLLTVKILFTPLDTTMIFSCASANIALL